MYINHNIYLAFPHVLVSCHVHLCTTIAHFSFTCVALDREIFVSFICQARCYERSYYLELSMAY